MQTVGYKQNQICLKLRAADLSSWVEEELITQSDASEFKLKQGGL